MIGLNPTYPTGFTMIYQRVKAFIGNLAALNTNDLLVTKGDSQWREIMKKNLSFGSMK
jgi:hypothetical protein